MKPHSGIGKIQPTKCIRGPPTVGTSDSGQLIALLFPYYSLPSHILNMCPSSIMSFASLPSIVFWTRVYVVFYYRLAAWLEANTRYANQILDLDKFHNFCENYSLLIGFLVSTCFNKNALIYIIVWIYVFMIFFDLDAEKYRSHMSNI